MPDEERLEELRALESSLKKDLALLEPIMRNPKMPYNTQHAAEEEHEKLSAALKNVKWEIEQELTQF